IGDLNVLDDPENRFSIVDSVANLQETNGGHPSESDDHYQRRLSYVLGSPSTAGAYDAYIFHALSSSHKVLDVGLLKPVWEIEIYVLPYDFENDILGDSGVQISNLELDGIATDNTDGGRLYWGITGTPTRVFSLYSDSAKSVLEAQVTNVNGVGLVIADISGRGLTGTVDLTGSTNDTDFANYVDTYGLGMGAVDQMFNPSTGYSKAKPINDEVSVYMATSKAFAVSKCDITIIDGNVVTIKTQAIQIIAAYLSILKSRVGLDAVKDQLKGMIATLPGVYQCDLELDGSPGVETITVNDDQFLDGTPPTVNVTVFKP
ncbi:MAG: hypothetical protein GY869_17055, partial [Planctomycetes bacterium]|nr:hypothetical protein [Planctomycetota bacterium]